jgi:hypothetical protein
MEYIAISLQAKVENAGYKVDFIVFWEGYPSLSLLNKLIRAMSLLYKF